MAPVLVHPVDIQLPLPLTPTNDSHDTRTRRRSSTFTTITNWASAVQPGSPAPLSPVKRRRPSLRRQVASNSSSPSFLFTSTHKPDLTSWGYTSVFVHLPVTPETPSPFRAPEPIVADAPAKSGNGLKKIKSMGILRRNRTKSIVGEPAAAPAPENIPPVPRPRTRSRSRSGSMSPTKPIMKRPGHVKSKSVSATTPTKSKSRSNRNHPPLPPSLQNELMLMQFASGGTLEANAQKLMKERSKADGQGVAPKAVDAVFRDENGVMWLDEDEPIEYEALLPTNPPSSPPASPWVQFSSSNAHLPASPAIGAIQADEDPVRRGSLASLSPTEHELQGAAAAVVRPASPSAYIGTAVGLLPPPNSSSSVDRSERRRRRRPAPLKLHSSSSIPTTAAQGFEDSFEPSSAEAAALAAGMYRHTHRRVGNSRRASAAEVVGSAPADVLSFDVARGTGKGRKMNLAKRAKALFGLE
ncbi:hypothetical protein PM082_023493 [Marasmius tenuissimus]|nr:hypothetical protein PM082_023493 [Marasmius tenuissimus]